MSSGSSNFELPNRELFLGLPYEVASLVKRISDLREDKHVTSLGLGEAVDESSETSHDNAPREALEQEKDKQDKLLIELVSTKHILTMVEYPDPNSTVVNIGSRVLCAIGDDQFLLDIVGNLPVLVDTEEGVERGNFPAPIPYSLLGANPGEKVKANLVDRVIVVDVISVNQTNQRAFYEQQDLT